MHTLTVLICTHNRADLLERVLLTLNAAHRPAFSVQVLVAANACTDDTLVRLSRYQSRQDEQAWLPLCAMEVPTPGKSLALNQAIPTISSEYVALVDDDHRIDENYLLSIERAITHYPAATLLCGRILPDWDGSEPDWVHDAGQYRIYPLPVPRYDQGDTPRLVTVDHGPLPGGGNLVLHRSVFERAGEFSTELGPRGHDLGGGEDSEFVLNALTGGEVLQYVPDIIQFHYVDNERLCLNYLLRKSYQRSRSVSRVHYQGSGVPRYVWRKLLEHTARAVFSLSWPKTRFYLMRTASTLGEFQGMQDRVRKASAHSVQRSLLTPGFISLLLLLIGMGLLMAGLVWMPAAMLAHVLQSVLMVSAAAGLMTLAVGIKSLLDFSTTGPEIRKEIRQYYTVYGVLAFFRLLGLAFVLFFLLGLAGAVISLCVIIASSIDFSSVIVFCAALFSMLVLTVLQLLRHLLYLPASISASMHYRMSRLYVVWRLLSPNRLHILYVITGASAMGLLLVSSLSLLRQGDAATLGVLWGCLLVLTGMVGCAGAGRELRPEPREHASSRPNIVMLGSDTLRADRLGVAGYRRALTPCIDGLGKTGTQFTQCYVPCARTAPSLLSLLTGCWPHTHGVRDNFVSDEEVQLSVPCLPALFKDVGYDTACVTDWCGADLGKFALGFTHVDAPDDQWNLKYLIRQGPKDLRLFLSLFTHNRFGKRFLPELYYLAGVPMTTLVGRKARSELSRLAKSNKPFFLNVFMSSTHPPFGSEYPYYTRYADPDYRGESKFLMARLTDPHEIIRRQGDSRKEFDLDQIVDLYDGCVKRFDDEVERVLEHVKACGLEKNTIVVIYSDHGMEFFEHETWGQGNSAVGDYSARIPLVLRDPRVQVGLVQNQVVRSVDIAPTLLELAGLPVPDSMQGVSLAGLVRGDTADMGLAAFNETGIWITDNLPGMHPEHLRYPNLFKLLEIADKSTGTMSIKARYREQVYRAKDRMIRLGDWKLVYQPLKNRVRFQLFDLASDPECRHDRFTDEPVIADTLRRRLLGWMADDPWVGEGVEISGQSSVISRQ